MEGSSKAIVDTLEEDFGIFFQTCNVPKLTFSYRQNSVTPFELSILFKVLLFLLFYKILSNTGIFVGERILLCR